MIPAASPHVALIGGVRHDVIAWSDSGDALVLDFAAGELKAARTLPGFTTVEPADEPLVAVVPGGGWMMRLTWDDGTTSVVPVLAWGIDRHGLGEAIAVDADGVVEPVRVSASASAYFHPDQSEDQPTQDGPDPAVRRVGALVLRWLGTYPEDALNLDALRDNLSDQDQQHLQPAVDELVRLGQVLVDQRPEGLRYRARRTLFQAER